MYRSRASLRNTDSGRCSTREWYNASESRNACSASSSIADFSRRICTSCSAWLTVSACNSAWDCCRLRRALISGNTARTVPQIDITTTARTPGIASLPSVSSDSSHASDVGDSSGATVASSVTTTAMHSVQRRSPVRAAIQIDHKYNTGSAEPGIGTSTSIANTSSASTTLSGNESDVLVMDGTHWNSRHLIGNRPGMPHSGPETMWEPHPASRRIE